MTNEKKGLFITLEGPDGSGKTTHFEPFCEMLRQAGFDVVATRQPGGSPTAEVIRQAVLGTPLEEPMDPVVEAMLYAASRRQVLKAVIEPALATGKVVVSDRWADSSFAYQGWARGIMKEFTAIRDVAHKDFWPDHTIYFDVTLEESLKRMEGRTKAFNRLNNEVLDFRKRCFEGYQALTGTSELSERWVLIDAMPPVVMVRNALQSWVNQLAVQHGKAQLAPL
jgi:dTMP kinase